MERSDSAGFDQTTSTGESEFGASGVGSSGTSGVGSTANIGSDTSKSFGDTQSSGGITDRLKSVGSSVKDKAAGLPGLLADGLEAGAKALKQRQPAAAGAEGTSVSVSSDSNITAVTETLATGMQSSADWLREADIEKLKTGVENQVKEHPARSLLIALGAGYLIGKVLRR
ncbi:MAG TPA: hypothetical protein VJ840_10575 [Gemmatimonadaceae bacterium]|nr:hypothetical protein [Gemmatimonadaceae bacterium]